MTLRKHRKQFGPSDLQSGSYVDGKSFVKVEVVNFLAAVSIIAHSGFCFVENLNARVPNPAEL
jgi:hypothetical protein